MSGLVLTDDDRAVISDRETGEVITCSVPTALENVAHGKGRFVHGRSGDLVEAPAADLAPEPEPTITLTEPDVLPLPVAEQPPVEPAPEPVIEPVVEPVVEAPVAETAPVVDPLDHDRDGKKGGAKPTRSTDPERAAIIAQLRAAQPPIKFFAGAKTEDLKALLPG